MKSHLQALLGSALASASSALGKPMDLPPGLQIDAAKDARHGDFATNLALVVNKGLGRPPRAVAELLVQHLPASEMVERVEIAGPGFINFFLTPAAFQAVIPQILQQGAAYGCDRSGARGRMLVEFVSANPTGPMHVGHGRGAAYGDSLANILAATGWDVHREYYINDAGRQVDILTVSVWLRYLQACGENLPFPQRAYPADYIRQTSERLKQSLGDALRHPAEAVLAGIPAEPIVPAGADEKTKAALKTQQENYIDALIERARSLLGADYARVQRAGLEDQLAAIRATLEAFGVRFDRWYSEKSLVDSGFARTAIERLSAAGHVYAQDGATWLRTTSFGDEKDRVLFKADGAATYFANDLAYHVDKLDRGYPVLLDVWGADHHGYIARVRAAIEALTGRTDALHVQLMQFVTLSSGRMGKRSGNFVTLQDLIDEAGKDATRFFYLLRSHDQHLEFDIELARSQSNDNPVFYVQYAHARICSVFRQLAERGQTFAMEAAAASLHRLSEPQEKHLLTVLQKYPEVLAASAAQFAPHQLAFYLRELADALHSYYNAHKFLTTPRSENPPGGDPEVDDTELQTARLALIAATRQVLGNALELLGVGAPESM
ncbi:arginine--tRNA ligase [Panacagrimonas sp.]|uniref:arginine--tRNA ligase n=1 Tax=Panacagrimonas sp. TaxID=2480088 RepID=UPI003B523C43